MANVDYKIKGTHDAKGINDAIKSMKRLKRTSQSLRKNILTLSSREKTLSQDR